MMAITRQNNIVSRAESEWRNSSERVIAIILYYTLILYF
jgi:hypothetical protein